MIAPRLRSEESRQAARRAVLCLSWPESGRRVATGHTGKTRSKGP